MQLFLVVTLLLAGVLLYFFGAKLLADAVESLKPEQIALLKQIKSKSLLAVLLYMAPVVAAFLVAREYPRFDVIALSLTGVYVALLYSVWYLIAVKRLTVLGLPYQYIKLFRISQIMIYIGLLILVSIVLFEGMELMVVKHQRVD